MPLRIAHIQEEGRNAEFVLTEYATPEEIKKREWQDENIEVLAVYTIDSDDQEKSDELMRILSALDTAYNGSIVDELIRAVFRSGYVAGVASRK